MKRFGIEYDIFIHVNKIRGEYVNVWTNEYTQNYDNNEDIIRSLYPKHYIYDYEDELENKIPFESYYTHLGNWTGMDENTTKILIKNMILSLYSRNEIVKCFQEEMEQYDLGIIMRPDMQLTKDINVSWFDELKINNILVPDKEWHYGCNDKLCIGKPNVVIFYGRLYEYLLDYSMYKSIVSEIYLMDMLSSENIDIIRKDIDYELIRIRK